jgi:hypothetical protein
LTLVRRLVSSTLVVLPIACSVLVDFDGFAGDPAAPDAGGDAPTADVDAPCEGDSCGECAPGLVPCDGTCVDLANDPLHCGSCNPEVSCGAEPCTLGKCGTLVWDAVGNGGCQRVAIDAAGEYAYFVRLESEVDAGGVPAGLFRVNLSTGAVAPALTENRPSSWFLALEGDSVFWTNISVPKGVWETPIAAYPGVTEDISLGAASTTNPGGVVASASHVFWSDRMNDRIVAVERAGLAASTLGPPIVKPFDLALSGDWLYVAASPVPPEGADGGTLPPVQGSVQRVNVASGALEIIESAAPGAHDIATTDLGGVRRVYWTQYATMMMAEQISATSWSVSPIGPNDVSLHGEDVVTDGEWVYWSMRQYPFKTLGQAPIYRQKADGSGLNEPLGELQVPKGLARFGAYLYVCTNAGLERIFASP